jgi:hypothetical protein
MTAEEATSIKPGMLVRLKSGLRKPALVIASEMLSEVYADPDNTPTKPPDVYLTVLSADGQMLKRAHWTWFNCKTNQQ